MTFNLYAYIHLVAPRATCKVDKIILLGVEFGSMALRPGLACAMYALYGLAVPPSTSTEGEDVDIIDEANCACVEPLVFECLEEVCIVKEIENG